MVTMLPTGKALADAIEMVCEYAVVNEMQNAITTTENAKGFFICGLKISKINILC
jgi:hypothetical protein